MNRNELNALAKIATSDPDAVKRAEAANCLLTLIAMLKKQRDQSNALLRDVAKAYEANEKAQRRARGGK